MFIEVVPNMSFAPLSLLLWVIVGVTFVVCADKIRVKCHRFCGFLYIFLCAQIALTYVAFCMSPQGVHTQYDLVMVKNAHDLMGDFGYISKSGDRLTVMERNGEKIQNLITIPTTTMTQHIVDDATNAKLLVFGHIANPEDSIFKHLLILHPMDNVGYPTRYELYVTQDSIVPKEEVNMELWRTAAQEHKDFSIL